jgi:hypothetical protein
MSKRGRGGAWAEGWYPRLRDGLARRGCLTLLELSDQMGDATYDEIADAFDFPVAPIQVLWVMREEFCEKGDMRGFVLDSLTRRLRSYLLPAPRDAAFALASAYACWLGDMDEESRTKADAVWPEVRSLVTGLSPGEVPSRAQLAAIIDSQSWRVPRDWRSAARDSN